MRRSDGVAFAFFALAVIATTWVFDFGCGRDFMKWQAIENRQAHYVLDEHNDKVFRWGPKQ